MLDQFYEDMAQYFAAGNKPGDFVRADIPSDIFFQMIFDEYEKKDKVIKKMKKEPEDWRFVKPVMKDSISTFEIDKSFDVEGKNTRLQGLFLFSKSNAAHIFIEPETKKILKLFDGTKTVKEIARTCFGEDIDTHLPDLISFCRMLYEDDFIKLLL
jgi:hypothetical protein